MHDLCWWVNTIKETHRRHSSVLVPNILASVRCERLQAVPFSVMLLLSQHLSTVLVYAKSQGW